MANLFFIFINNIVKIYNIKHNIFLILIILIIIIIFITQTIILRISRMITTQIIIFFK